MFCDLYACIKLFISNNLRIYDVRRYYRFESRTHRFLRKGKSSVNIELQSFFLLSLPPAHTEHIKRYFLFIHKFMMPY